jgi:hypothetical protein
MFITELKLLSEQIGKEEKARINLLLWFCKEVREQNNNLNVPM